MLAYCPLASGSKGNSLLVKTEQTSILIDCGLSFKSLKARLALSGQKIEEISAILVTHEHGDHIQGIKTFLHHHPVPIICNGATADAMAHYFQEKLPCHLFTTYESFFWKDLEVTAFSVSHDSVDPVGFRLSSQGITLGVCTDLGFVSALIPHMLSNCHLLYIEANHEPGLLQASKRPEIYKQRVLSKSGHLSNESCGQLLHKVISSKLQHVYLAHLSRDSNDAELAKKVVRSYLEEPHQRLSLEAALQETTSSWVFGCKKSRSLVKELVGYEEVL